MFSVNHSTQLFRWIPIWKHSGNWNEFVMSWKNVFDETNDVLLNSTRASDRSFYSIFNKRIYHLETMLAIWRPKKVLSPGSLCWPLAPSPQSKCLKRIMLPQSITLQFQIGYQSHWNVSCKTKTSINFRGQTWVRPPAKFWVKGFTLPQRYHGPNFYQRFWHTLAN